MQLQGGGWGVSLRNEQRGCVSHGLQDQLEARWRVRLENRGMNNAWEVAFQWGWILEADRHPESHTDH